MGVVLAKVMMGLFTGVVLLTFVYFLYFTAEFIYDVYTRENGKKEFYTIISVILFLIASAVTAVLFIPDFYAGG